MTEQEELDLIQLNLGKIRPTLDHTGKKVVSYSSEEALSFVAKKMDIVRENFQYFATSQIAIMYPEEFIFAINNLPNGNELIIQNIDFLLKRVHHKRAHMLGALADVEGLGNAFLADFKKRFFLFVHGKEEELEDLYVNKNFNSRDTLSHNDEEYKVPLFLRLTANCNNAAKIFEENKELFLSPRYNCAIHKIVSICSQNPELKDFLVNNFDRILNCAKEDNIVRIYKQAKGFKPDAYNKHAFLIEELYDKAIQYVENKGISEYSEDYKSQRELIENVFGRIILQDKSEEISTLVKFILSENKNSSIEICGIGAFSIAIKIGDRVLKIGADRETKDFEIPSHPRLIRPIIRKQNVSGDVSRPIYLEIQDEVDTHSEITDEELLMVYKELRDAGIKWCDPTKKNLGRLKKDNYGYPIGLGVPSNNKSIGFIGEDSLEKPLRVGNLVIIDLDFIYPENHPEAVFTYHVPEFIRQFERQYCKDREKSNKDESHEEH